MLAILNYTEQQHFITWIKPWGSAGLFVWSAIQTESCSLASVLIASPTSSYNMRASKCFSKEARENIACLFLFHLREMHRCPLQSLSRSVFKPWEHHSHFYCLTYFGLLSVLSNLISCSSWSVLASPSMIHTVQYTWPLSLLWNTWFKELDF